MHIVTLIWADPPKVGDVARGYIQGKLGERHNTLHTPGIVADIREVEERIVLYCVQIAWNCLPWKSPQMAAR